MTQRKTEYGRLVSRFHRVRRAWKRTAAMSGLAVLLTEGAGIVALGALVEFLFAPRLVGRVAIGAGVIATMLFLLIRHVLSPVFRRITDAQLALYLEERNPTFEGSLIAAAEFGDQAESDQPSQQDRIIDSIIHEAVIRAERFDVRSAIDLSRLHKYGLLAVLILVGYGTLGLLMPDTVARHVTRVLAPWQQTERETAEVNRQAQAMVPIEFSLSRSDSRLLRGSAFDLEAVLTRKPFDGAYFHFRGFDPKNDKAAWKMLSMKEVEKLNGYQIVLPDVNEDLEYFVSAAGYKSTPHRIAVFDPLVVQGVEVRTRFPDYLQLPERVESGQSADVAAPAGAQITVRVLANRPLASGTFKWEDGKTQPLQVDAKEQQNIVGTFPVVANGLFEYRIRDIDGQEVTSGLPASVRALPDQAPIIKLVEPLATVTTNPLGEISVAADVADDFGIAAVEIVCTRGADENAQPFRQTLQVDLQPASEGRVAAVGRAHGVLFLENLSPAIQPGETLAYYLEVRDRKGQKAVTELSFVVIEPFDAWAFWMKGHPHAPHQTRSFEPVVKATWRLHSEKESMPPADFNRQTDELAATMIDSETGEVAEYVDLTKVAPDKMPHAERAIEKIKTGHGALKKRDTQVAVRDFRVALAELNAAGLLENLRMLQPSGAEQVDFQQKMKQLTVMMAQQPPAATDAAPPEKTSKAEKDEAMRQKAADLQKQQEKIAEKLNDIAKKDAAKPEAAKDPKPTQEVAPQQNKVADATKEMAEKLKVEPDPKAKQAAAKLDDAAKAMQEAAKHAKAGETDKAKDKADDAARQLAAVARELKADEADEIAAALDKAEDDAHKLIQRQQENRKKAEDVAKALPANKVPDARQERDLKVAAHEQAQINVKVEQVVKQVADLKKAADDGKMKPEMAKQVDEADRQANRARVQQKAANAAVELAANRPEEAAAEQKKVEAALEKVAEAVRAANDARAADFESELKRAKGEADRIADNLQKVKEKDPAKADPQAKKDAAEKVAADAQRLARHLQHREFRKDDADFQKDAQKLKEIVGDPSSLQKRIEDEKDKEAEFARVTARLQNKLEAEYQSALAAKKLFTAQREECPPQYRQLVNRYFEALSTKKQ